MKTGIVITGALGIPWLLGVPWQAVTIAALLTAWYFERKRQNA